MRGNEDISLIIRVSFLLGRTVHVFRRSFLTTAPCEGFTLQTINNGVDAEGVLRGIQQVRDGRSLCHLIVISYSDRGGWRPLGGGCVRNEITVNASRGRPVPCDGDVRAGYQSEDEVGWRRRP